MIVQSAPDGEPRLVITMAEHTALAGQVARAFGNDRFGAVTPADEMFYIIDNHDAGWAELDGAAATDDRTGLPFNLVETPFEKIIVTSKASPEFNSRHHAYCGLLSSMHSWGLYNGRYGLSSHVLLDQLAEANRAAADRMLDGELERQDRLKAELARDPATAKWIDQDHLMQNYKQLQFCDTLALYFNCKHEGAREAQTFEHVPMDEGRDATITVEPLGGSRYRVAPYPFAEDNVELSFTGRYAPPPDSGAPVDLAAIAASSQSVRCVAS
jgi:hypothetical protein